jgi:pyruvate carboxylase
MHVSIEKGKMLIIRLMAIGSVTEGKGTRDVWFEVNGEVRAVPVEDRSAAVETVSRERSTSDPGSVGAPMSGVVVEVRVKEGQEVKKGDILCIQSAMKASTHRSYLLNTRLTDLIDGECSFCTRLRSCQASSGPRRRLTQSRRLGCGNCALTL